MRSILRPTLSAADVRRLSEQDSEAACDRGEPGVNVAASREHSGRKNKIVRKQYAPGVRGGLNRYQYAKLGLDD